MTRVKYRMLMPNLWEISAMSATTFLTIDQLLKKDVSENKVGWACIYQTFEASGISGSEKSIAMGQYVNTCYVSQDVNIYTKEKQLIAGMTAAASVYKSKGQQNVGKVQQGSNLSADSNLAVLVLARKYSMDGPFSGTGQSFISQQHKIGTK